LRIQPPGGPPSVSAVSAPEPARPAADDPFGGAAALGGESSFHLADLLPMLERRWRLIALAIALCASVALLRYAVTPREYRAETQIQIERRSLSNLAASSQGNAMAWLENWWNLEYYPTQYRLLQSRGLAERVVRNLRLAEDPQLNPGGSAGAAPTGAEDEAALGRLAAGLLAGLEVTPIANTQLVVIAYRSGEPRQAARIANGFADAFIDWGIENRSETVGKASGFLSQQIAELKQEISQKEVSLQRLTTRGNLISGGGDGEPVTSVTLERLTALNEAYSGAQSDRIGREARFNSLVATPAGGLETVAMSIAPERIGQQRTELLALEREYETSLKTFKPDYPKMVELRGRIERQRQSLDTEIRKAFEQAKTQAQSDLAEAQRRESRLGGEIAALREQNLRDNSGSAERSILVAELQSKRNQLNDLLGKQSEAEVTSRLQETRESNVRVVDRALVPGGPFRPSLRRELTLGLGLGLMLGLGLVVLLEFLDRTLKEPQEVEKLLGLPTLAVIPDVSDTGRSYRKGYGYGYGYGAAAEKRPSAAGNKAAASERKGEGEDVAIELLPHLRPRLAVAESYRSLRTALLLSSANELKVVSLTSAESGEGKTTTAVNLAVVLAQLGRQVLLIDGDLRRPRLHEVMKVSNRVGLVNLLTGAGSRSEEVFLRTPVPNLLVLPSGPIAPNPAELLASERMREFVAHVRAHFDYVVIDSPPTLAVTDATLIGSLSDGVLLCLRAGRVTREDARACLARLMRSEVKLLGTVLNGHLALQGRYSRRYYKYAPYGDENPVAESRDSAA
jgi:polysaccharide biosynthesis transport protein